MERSRKLRTARNSRKQRRSRRKYKSMERTTPNLRSRSDIDREDIHRLCDIRDRIERQQEN